jgi:hypothetical protein
MPSHSPVIHPGHITGPPNRVCSPAYSDMRSMSHTPMPAFIRAPSVATMGSSPHSLRPYHQGPPGYRREANASYTSLIRLPSPAVSFSRNSPYLMPMALRAPTPSSASFRHQAMISNPSLQSIPRSPTGSSVPQYYDYSESFLEDENVTPYFTQDPSQPPLNMDQTVLAGMPIPPPRDAQTPFGTKEGSAFLPVELPTDHNRALDGNSPSSFNGVIPKRVSSLGAAALHRSTPEPVQS